MIWEQDQRAGWYQWSSSSDQTLRAFSFKALNGLDDDCLHWGSPAAFLSSPIYMLLSSKNTFGYVGFPRPSEMAHKMNHHFSDLEDWRKWREVREGNTEEGNWQRGPHGFKGQRMFILHPTLSSWLLLLVGGDRAAADPLAGVVIAAFVGILLPWWVMAGMETLEP